MDISISDSEFARFQKFIHEKAGIRLSEAKKPLVSGRLAGRLRVRDVSSFSDYFALISVAHEAAEMQVAIDLLTTNETYFFREPKHFDFLRQHVSGWPATGQPFRVWSAASSSGEEAYSIAMLLEDRLGARPWEIFASDLSTRVLASARRGQYSMERASGVPPEFLRRFCLKGKGSESGTLLVARELAAKVEFAQINLNESLPDVGMFDVIFLRNVMIYFDTETKRAVVTRLLEKLRPEGYFFIGHSETLHGIDESLETIAPAIFRKPRRH